MLRKAISGVPTLSIVVPIYNEEAVLSELTQRIRTLTGSLEIPVEIVYVNDGSRDNSWHNIEEICEQDHRFVGVSLSRNFGHQLAVSAGLEEARGAIVAILDADLQDPPELIPQMMRKLEEGYDVVYGIRTKRKEGWFKKLMYASFYRTLQQLANIPIPLDSGDFCVMTRRVVDVLKSMPERRRFVRGLRSYAGFRQAGLTYERSPRLAGKPKYSMIKLLSLASDGIFTFSEKPLRIATGFGATVSAGALLYGMYLIIWRVMTNQHLPGFATLAVGMFFLGGIQLLCLGILGEYIGRIHTEVKKRPAYIIDRVIRAPAKLPEDTETDRE